MLHNLLSRDTSRQTQQKSSKVGEFEIWADHIPKCTSQSDSNKKIDKTSLQPQALPGSIGKDRLRKYIKTHQIYAKANSVAYVQNVAESIDSSEEPSNYSKVINWDDYRKWMIFMQKDMESIHKNNTLELVKLYKGKKIICYK